MAVLTAIRCLLLLASSQLVAESKAAAFDDLPSSYASRLSAQRVTTLYPASWKRNVVANWPKIQLALNEAGLGNDRNLVLYALATIRVETLAFSPKPEGSSRYSVAFDKITYAGARGPVLKRDFGAYDSSVRVERGRLKINKDLGNCFHRGQDDALMRSRHGDPPMPLCDDGFRYRGRGFVQLTGRSNYASLQKLLHPRLDIDLVNQPDLAADPDNAARILAGFIAVRRTEIGATLARRDYRAARKAVNTAALGLKEFTDLLKAADRLGF